MAETHIPTSTPNVSYKDEEIKMKAVEWHGTQDVRYVDRPKPLITDPHDCVLRVTTTTICGSDLHFYYNLVEGMEKGDVIGHEFMGIVDEVGQSVEDIKPGDRVVVSAIIACGRCWYCKNQYFSCCDTTNPSAKMEEMYGHRTAGLFGYSHLCGGFDGGQAEYVRVPFADVNCLKVPDNLPDEKVLFLSDIVCTGFHATELAKVKEGDTVAIWGCGPVGLMTIAWCKFKKAKKIIAIDNIPYRLKKADELGACVINFDDRDVLQTIKEMIPMGPDIGIECAGFRFPKTLSHRIQRALKVESDSMDILKEIIMAVRKCGTISIVGDYFAYGNQFPIGAFMEKGLSMTGSQVFVQKYWKEILHYISTGEFDPTFVITHHLPLEDIQQAYKIFANNEEDSLKVLLHTPFYYESK